MSEQEIESAEIVQDQPDSQEIAVSPIAMMTQVYSKKGDITGLKDILELQIQWEKNEARKAFHAAMARFKANAPEIVKDKKVQAGQAKYTHATLGNVTKTINQALGEHGLSISWNTAQIDGVIAVTCKITHVLGHSEETTLKAKADLSGSKNDIQGIGSAVSYLQRYTCLLATGLATSDQDDGGIKADEFISAEQVAELEKQMVELDIKADQFCAYLKVGAVKEIRKADYAKAINAIESKRNRTAKK